MQTVLGVFLAMLGGFMAGNCMVPLEYLRRWKWENAWIVFSLVALIVVPWTLALFRVPDLMGVYASVNMSDFARPFLFGAGWGVAQVLFGLAVLRIGMALSFATTIGLGAALGALVPILLRHPEVLKTAHGHRSYRLQLGRPAARERAESSEGYSGQGVVHEWPIDGRHGGTARTNA